MCVRALIPMRNVIPLEVIYLRDGSAGLTWLKNKERKKQTNKTQSISQPTKQTKTKQK